MSNESWWHVKVCIYFFISLLPKTELTRFTSSPILIKLSLLFMEVAKFTKPIGYPSLPFIRKGTNTGARRLRYSRDF